MVIRRWGAIVAGVAVALASCSQPDPPPVPGPVHPAWQAMVLPAPPEMSNRVLVRDAVACGGRWYAVGGIAGPAGENAPAAWTTSDGLVWSAVPMVPSSMYGARHLLYAVACRDGRMVALGAASGGAHGNPRTATWAQHSDGGLREAPAGFELFGGPRAVSVSRVAAGPLGWLLVGARLSGAAVWTSRDGERFTVHEALPELASDDRGRTVAYDAVAVPAGWLAVGAVLVPGAVPVAWSSSDARVWRRVELPGADGRGQAQRVVATGDAVLAVGPVRDGFGVWRWADSGWRWAGAFGSGSRGALSVRALVAAGGRVVTVSIDGDGYRLWCSADGGGSWRPVALPVEVPAGETALVVALRDDRLMVFADAGGGSRAWWAHLSAGC
ncbi:hypothetical protein E0H26_10510 [Micromonospora zingiberis]|uniref:Exo-alpha-sialidase n=1 Tax=Micromonospora zingiberis TaxID=2053011 RepID=A0A4R0GQJ1_9ACTN|nr:hypothetical protein [Micromonospora zingiberis]TCB98009.1 hypothetical protein E0H26_10510 [Micromonospora zingiberis]